MTFQTLKNQRVEVLIALCVKNDKHPGKPAFADKVTQFCSGYLDVTDRRTIRGYIDILINAWNLDNWKTRVENNLRLTEEERKFWISSHSSKRLND